MGLMPLRLNERKRTTRAVCRIFAAILLCWLLWCADHARAAVTTPPDTQDIFFPVYPSIKPNVDFWVRIFTQVSKFQGVVHDSRDLSIVYETIRLYDGDTAAGRKKNKNLKKRIIKKYRTALLKLSSGARPATPLEKKVAALFSPGTNAAAFKRAAYNIRIQRGIKEDFKGGLIRSGAYIKAFKNIFQSHGLPTDLVYLPCVESSFRYTAYSKFGAAGIWQFTRSTGRRYMDIGYVVDERRDPFISTVAAARLLKRNFTELKEWPLAITAYNHGLNGMRRAKKAHGSYEKIFKSYRSPSFKFASRNFYAEFLAARLVARNHETYFGPLKFDTPRRFHTIKAGGFLSVRDIETRLNIKASALKALNPSLRSPVFTDQKYIPKGFELRLPVIMSKKEAERQLALVYRDKQKPSRFHRVRKGDTAGAVARLHSVSLRDLVLANGLNRRATIYVGQNLRIPVPGEAVTATEKAIPPSNRPLVIVAAETASADKKEAAPPLPGKQPAATPRETPAIEIPEGGPVDPTIMTDNLRIIETARTGGMTIGIITVAAEETLGHYADWLGIRTQSIRNLNRLKFGIPITIDQSIKLPLGAASPRDFEEKRYEYHKEIEDDFFASYTVLGTEQYKIRKGDNIWNLCLNELEVPFWLLKKYNPHTRFQNLKPDQTILYPIIGKKEQE